MSVRKVGVVVHPGRPPAVELGKLLASWAEDHGIELRTLVSERGCIGEDVPCVEEPEFAPGLDHLHPDVRVISSTWQQGFEGRGGVRRLVGDWDRAFEDWSLRVEDLVDCPDGRRLAVGRVRMHGKKTGTELDRPVALLFTLDEGLIVRIEAFVNRLNEAYAAAGLPLKSSS